MLKILGSDICKDSLASKIILREKGVEFEYIDIVASTNDLKNYLKFRAMLPDFAPVREDKTMRLGIPYFMMGTKGTFDLNEALVWCGQEPVEASYLENLVAQMVLLLNNK